MGENNPWPGHGPNQSRLVQLQPTLGGTEGFSGPAREGFNMDLPTTHRSLFGMGAPGLPAPPTGPTANPTPQGPPFLAPNRPPPGPGKEFPGMPAPRKA